MPRDFQLERINHCAFEDDAFIIVILRTVDGKSLVPLKIVTLRHGVVILIVLLSGLGSDQIEKVIVREHSIEAYHIDKHCRATRSLKLLSYYSSLHKH